MIDTILLYEDYQDILFTTAYPDLAIKLNLIDVNIFNILSLKGITLSRNQYADILSLNADIDLKNKYVITPINIASFENKTDIDFAIDLNVLVNKYDNVFYYHSQQSKLNTKLDVLTTIDRIISGDSQDLIFMPIITNENIYFENNVQPLLTYHGCNIDCNSCPVKDTIIKHDRITDDVFLEAERLINIGLNYIPVTHFMLNHIANTKFLYYYEDFINIAKKYDTKFIVTITPVLSIEEMSKFIALLPYIDVLYIELNALDDKSAYSYTPEDSYNLLKLITNNSKSTMLIIGLITIGNNNKVLLNIIRNTVPYVHCYLPTFVSVDTDFTFDKLNIININLYKRFKAKLNE